MDKNTISTRLENVQSRFTALNDKIQAGTLLTEDEATELRTLDTEIKSLESAIDQKRTADSIAARTAGMNFETQNPNLSDPRSRQNRVLGEEAKIHKRYSTSRAVQHFAGKLPANVDAGLEVEMHQEGERIARASGLPVSGQNGVFIPDVALRSGTTAPLDAGNLVPTSQSGVVDGYRYKLMLENLGVTVQDAMPGVNNIPVADFLAEAGFVAEAALTPVNIAANVRRPQLTAKAIYAKVLNNWYLQANASEADTVLNRTLLEAEATVLNKTIITRGAGTVASKGLMEADDVIDVSAANGSALGRDLLVKMINSPDANNAIFNNPAFVCSPTIRERLMNLKVDEGSGQFVWNLGSPDSLLGYNAVTTTLMPTNLEKGTGGATKQGVLFGHWSELIVLRWPVRQLIVNPYSNNDGVETKLISFWDWAARNPKAFARAFFTA
jgi:HK97 family phage major capsid protein